MMRRRLTPKLQKSPRNFIERRVFSAIDVANWSENEYIHRARRDGITVAKKDRPLRFYHASKSSSCYVRIERQQTARELAKALFYYADRTIQGNYIFEVRLGAIELAKAIGQLHKHDRVQNKRMSYEPVRNCLNEFVRAGLLVEVTGWDDANTKRCAKRYFLTPAFFMSFHFRVSDLMKHIQKRYQVMSPEQRKNELANYKNQQERIRRRQSIAQIRSRALARKLQNTKQSFLNVLQPHQSEPSISTPSTDDIEQLQHHLSSLIDTIQKSDLVESLIKILEDNPLSAGRDDKDKRRRELKALISKLSILIG